MSYQITTPGICRSPTFYGESIRALLDDFEEDVMGFEENRRPIDMMVRDIDYDDYDEYYENYTLPEEQLYGYENLLEEINNAEEDDGDEEEEETDSDSDADSEITEITDEIRDYIEENRYRPYVNIIGDSEDDEEEDIQLHPNITVRSNREQPVNFISDNDSDDE